MTRCPPAGATGAADQGTWHPKAYEPRQVRTRALCEVPEGHPARRGSHAGQLAELSPRLLPRPRSPPCARPTEESLSQVKLMLGSVHAAPERRCVKERAELAPVQPRNNLVPLLVPTGRSCCSAFIGSPQDETFGGFVRRPQQGTLVRRVQSRTSNLTTRGIRPELVTAGQ